MKFIWLIILMPLLAFVGICLVVISNGLQCLTDCFGFGE